MRRAFSKPTADREQWDVVRQGFRPAGFAGLQLKAGQYADFLGAPERFTATWGDDPGLVSALIAFGGLDQAGRSQLDAVIDFAGAVGSERVVFCHDHPHDGVTAEERRAFVADLGRHASRAADLGVRISLHHHRGQPVMTPDDVRAVADLLQAHAVGLTVDTGHLAVSGVDDLPGFVDEFAAVIDNVHLKDCESAQWRLAGEGVLDLAGVLAALERHDYDGWLCVDEESAAAPDVGLRASQRWLDAHS